MIDPGAAARSEWIARPASTPGRRASAMRRDAAHVGGRVEGEAALLGPQRAAVEAAALVEHRQDREADAGVGGGVGERPRERERIVGVGRAVLAVLQVMELADLRVAAAQQLDVEMGGDRAQRLRRDAGRDRVHARAPRPEIVVFAAALAPFGEARERALERMAVRIDEARQHRAREAEPHRRAAARPRR